MNARSRAADSETQFQCADVTSTLVPGQCAHISKTSPTRQHSHDLRTVAELANDLVLGRPGAGLTHGRFSRSSAEAGAACRSFVSFEGSFWLFRWHFSGAGQRRAAIAGWDHEPCGVSRGVGASRSRATDGRKSATVLVAHSWTKLVGLLTISGQDATGFLWVWRVRLVVRPSSTCSTTRRAAPRRVIGLRRDRGSRWREAGSRHCPCHSPGTTLSRLGSVSTRLRPSPPLARARSPKSLG